MSLQKALRILREIKSCPEGMEWLEQQSSVEEAWYACEDGDWMMRTLSVLDIWTRDQFKGIGEEPCAPSGYPHPDHIRRVIPWEQVEAWLNSRPD